MMRRPGITDEMIEHALRIAANEMGADFETLQRAYAYPTDGFELALKLHCQFSWDIERDDLDCLDAIDINIERLHKQRCKEWFAENDIQPPFPIGTEIIEGVITGIYEYGVAIYQVKERDCKQENRRLLVKFENAKLPEYSRLNSARSLAIQYRQDNPQYTGGVVVICDNEVSGWVNELRDPESWVPGCIAVLADGACYIATGGNAQDGACEWQNAGGAV